MIFKKLSGAGIFIQSVLILGLLALHLFLPVAGLGFDYRNFGHVHFFQVLNNFSLPGHLWSKLSGIVLFTLAGFLFNLIAIRNDLAPRQSIFMVLIYLMFMLMGDMISGSLVTPAVTLLLLYSLYNIIRMHSEPNAYARVMNATIAVSVASLFYPQAIIFIFFVWFGFFTLRISSWREWIISFIGLLTPYFYFTVYLFLTDKLPAAFAGYKLFFMNYRIDFREFGLWEVLAMTLPFMIILFSIPVFLSDAGERVIAIRKKMWLIFNFLWTGLVVFFISGKAGGVWLPVIFLPVALIFTHRIVTRRKSWIMDVLVIIFAGLIIFLKSGF